MLKEEVYQLLEDNPCKYTEELKEELSKVGINSLRYVVLGLLYCEPLEEEDKLALKTIIQSLEKWLTKVTTRKQIEDFKGDD